MSNREIQGVGGPRDHDEPLVWKPWQPPVVPAAPATGPLARGAGGEPLDAPRPRVATDELSVTHAASGQMVGPTEWPEPKMLPAEVDAFFAAEATPALTKLGTVERLRDVSRALSRPTFDAEGIAGALGGFVDHLDLMGGEIAGVSGVGLALEALGGMGAIVSGARLLRDELNRANEQGRSGLRSALGASVGAAKLVGGMAMALSAIVPALLPVAGTALLAGAALQIGLSAWERRGAKAKAGSAAAPVAPPAPMRVVSNNGASAPSASAARAIPERAEPLRVLANNGARMQTDSVSFSWLEGGLRATV